MCGTLHSKLPYAPAQRKLAGHAVCTVQAYISWQPKDLCRDLDGEADVAIRSCRAPGTNLTPRHHERTLPGHYRKVVEDNRLEGRIHQQAINCISSVVMTGSKS
jgi:hypothetical protein